jgi:hypothetical protein
MFLFQGSIDHGYAASYAKRLPGNVGCPFRTEEGDGVSNFKRFAHTPQRNSFGYSFYQTLRLIM